MARRSTRAARLELLDESFFMLGFDEQQMADEDEPLGRSPRFTQSTRLRTGASPATQQAKKGW